MAAPDGDPPRFVELECLTKTGEGHYEWKETSRWIKLEEDIEVGSGRWCKPYIPSLRYKAIIDLRQLLQNGDLLLDVDERTLQGVANRLCESLAKEGILTKNSIHVFHATLLARHRHRHNPHNTHHVWHRRKQHDLANYANNLTLLHLNPNPSELEIHNNTLARLSVSNAMKSPVMISLLEEDGLTAAKRSSITKFMTEKSEASTILVAEVPYASKPSVLFARLRNGVVLGNLTEVSLPVKFVFLVIGPSKTQIDYLQIGRALGILMADNSFREMALECDSTIGLLDGIEDYLIRSNIVPDGKWDSKIWNQSLNKWSNMVEPNPILHNRRKTVVSGDHDDAFAAIRASNEQPLERIGSAFGGLIRDVKRKVPSYCSDFKDGFNLKCLLSIIVVWISFITQTITFGALLSEETGQLLGLAEMCYATAVSGILFSLFGGQPLLILGATGPIYVMESSIYKLSQQLEVEFLSWRIWIGLWTTLIFIVIVALDLSFLIRYITAGIEEIITALISTVFIFESFDYIFSTIQEYNTRALPMLNETIASNLNTTASTNLPMDRRYALPPMSIILMVGTYLSCHFIRKIRYTRFFSVNFRRLLSDFGILITILVFLGFDLWMEDDYTHKLVISDHFTLTSPSKRGWLINIMGEKKRMSVPYIFLAVIPAFLVTIVLFIETEVTATIMDRAEHKLKKGSGYSLDLLTTGILVTFCSFFGLPWMCACQVHSVLHLNSLSVLSKNHAPGTRAHIIKVIEQRLTNITVSILIGLSIFFGPILRLIPLAIPFGVFLYLGVTSLAYLQLVERIKLMFIPAKRHPNYRYLRKVKIKKVHLFTVIQTLSLIAVMAVKNSIIAPSFPFFILMLIPLKTLMKKYFTEEELNELDGMEEEDVKDDLDEYDVVRVKT